MFNFLDHLIGKCFEMTNEFIEKIYLPILDSEWVIVKTTSKYYSLRLGGFKHEDDIDGNKLLQFYEQLDFSDEGSEIRAVYADDEWMYLVLEKEKVLVSGWVSIDSEGDLKLGLRIEDRSEYEPEFFDSEFLSKLKLGSDGWSLKEK